MKLPKEAITEYQQAYFNTYGIEIDFDTAKELAENLLSLVYEVLPAKKDLDEYGRLHNNIQSAS